MHNGGENLATPIERLATSSHPLASAPTLVSIPTGLPLVQQRTQVRDAHIPDLFASGTSTDPNPLVGASLA